MAEESVKLSKGTARRLIKNLQEGERNRAYSSDKTLRLTGHHDHWLQVMGREEAPWQSDKYVYLVDVYAGLYDEEPILEGAKMINSLETFQDGATIGPDMVLKAVDFIFKDDGGEGDGGWYYVCTGDYPLEFWAGITGASLISGQHNRWECSWVEKIVNKVGSFQDKPAGRTSASTGWKLYNSIEANNAETGTQGNSVNLDLLPDGTTIQSIRGAPVVRVRHEWNCDNESELYVCYENGLQPDCEQVEEEE